MPRFSLESNDKTKLKKQENLKIFKRNDAPLLHVFSYYFNIFSILINIIFINFSFSFVFIFEAKSHYFTGLHETF